MYNPYYIFDTDGDDVPTAIPLGGEGIVKDINGYLWILNEGATARYCQDAPDGWDWPGNDNLDCTHQLLRINPITLESAENGEADLMQNGSITLTGSGINHLGRKVGLIIAQNKRGEVYYSLGWIFSISESGGSLFGGGGEVILKLELARPFSENPYGFIPTANGYHDFGLNAYRPRVWVEDIKGLVIFNLDEERGDSDDWRLDTIDLAMDSSLNIRQHNNEYVSEDNEYNKKINLNYPVIFGDHNLDEPYSGDAQFSITLFDTIYGSGYKEITFDGNLSTQNVNYRDIYRVLSDIREDLNNCYLSGQSIQYCIGTTGPRAEFRCALMQIFNTWSSFYNINNMTNRDASYDLCD